MSTPCTSSVGFAGEREVRGMTTVHSDLEQAAPAAHGFPQAFTLDEVPIVGRARDEVALVVLVEGYPSGLRLCWR